MRAVDAEARRHGVAALRPQGIDVAICDDAPCRRCRRSCAMCACDPAPMMWSIDSLARRPIRSGCSAPPKVDFGVVMSRGR
jgi:hypothetical protein